MAYTSFTQNDLTKWWVTGTGSVVNRLSEVMDDSTLGPCIQQLDAANAWQANGATTDEFIIAQATKPDSVWENLSGWRQMTNVADDTAEDALNADEWTWYTGGWTVVRLSDDSDPNDTDIREFYAWDGSGAGPVFMTEYIEDEIYQIHLSLEIGDGATSTTLESPVEYIHFDDGAYPLLTPSSTLTLGKENNNRNIHGSTWAICDTSGGDLTVVNGGVLYVYGSRIHNAGASELHFKVADITLYDSIFSGTLSDGSNSNKKFRFFSTINSFNLRNCIFTDLYTSQLDVTFTSVIGFGVFNSNRALAFGALTYTIKSVQFGGNTLDIYTSFSSNCIINLVDPILSAALKLQINEATGIVRQQYTCNIKVLDKDGVAIQSAVVDCEDTNTDAVWPAGTISTDASGDITEQIVTYKTWTGTSETLATFSPHKFTLSKAGYETLILENVTVDHPIVWHLELKGPVRYKLDSDTFFQDDS